MNNTFLSRLLEKQFIISALLIGLAFVIAIVIGTKTVASRGSGEVFSVTGSATLRVTSDIAKTTLTASRKVGIDESARGYALMAEDIKKVHDFVSQAGIPETAITIQSPSIYEQSTYDNNGNVTDRWYEVSQSLIVNSDQVATVKDLALNVGAIAEQGVFVQVYGPEYYYTKLPEKRVELMGAAVKDARDRAQAIAKNARARLGSLSSASMGVVQVLSPNSTDISDYGTYDTSTIEKDIMITVRSEFRIR